MNGPAQDDGFTLVELLVATIIAGIIAVVLGNVLLVGFKTTFAAGEVLNESANAQQLSQFLVPDVQSAGNSGIDISASPAWLCSGAAPAGANVVSVSWAEPRNLSATDVASYRLSAGTLVRYSCVNGGSPTATIVTREVIGTPTTTLSGVGLLSVTITVDNPSDSEGAPPYTFTVKAGRRTPGVSCEPQLGSIVIASVPAPLTGSHLTSPLTVTFTTIGPCSAANVIYQYGGAGVTATVAASLQASGSWTATIPSSAQTWTPSNKALTVTAGASSITSTFLVYDPSTCSISTPVAGAGTVSAGTMTTTSPITFTTAGACGTPPTPSVGYEYDSSGALATAATVTGAPVGSPTNWSVSPQGSDPAGTGSSAWTTGSKAVSVFVAGQTVTTTFTITAPPCTIAFANAPYAATLPVGHALSGPRLSATVAVTLSLAGGCAIPPTLDYTYDGTATTGTVTATGSGANWTATIPIDAPAAGNWTTGSKTLTASGGAVSATSTLTVSGACGLNPLVVTLTPATRTKQGASNLDNSVDVTFTTSAGCVASQLPITYQWGSLAQTRTITPTGGPTSWTATIAKNTTGDNWTPGDKAVSVTVGTGPDAVTTTATLKVNP